MHVRVQSNILTCNSLVDIAREQLPDTPQCISRLLIYTLDGFIQYDITHILNDLYLV